MMPATPDDKLGFPNRSTPSFAAEMMADPSIEASKREGRDGPKPCETEPVVGPAGGPCRAVRIGLLCWRLEA